MLSRRCGECMLPCWTDWQIELIQHTTVLIIFPPNLQTIIKANMLSTGGKGDPPTRDSALVKMAISPKVHWFRIRKELG